MNTIKSLSSVRINGKLPSTRLKALNLEAGTVRVPLIFLIDISGSMSTALPVINKTLTKLMGDIYSAEGPDRFMVDLAIITFGEDSVKVAREFDLLHPGEQFQISVCEGRTPLSTAMLYAYWYGAARKQQYKENEVLYNQPVVVIISDFFENSFGSVEVDGSTYSGDQLYDEMAELYSTAFNTSYKQYTYVITPPDKEVDHDRINKLKVDVVKDEHLDIARVLAQVLAEYKASVAMAAMEDEESNAAMAAGDVTVSRLGEWPPILQGKQIEPLLPDDPAEDLQIVEC